MSNNAAPSTWETPNVMYTQPNAYLSLPPTGANVLGALNDILKMKLSSANNWINPTLRRYVYTDDPATSNINILPIFEFKPKSNNTFPFVLLKPDGVQYQSMGIEDYKSLLSFNPGNQFVGEQNNVMILGKIEIGCISLIGLEALSIVEDIQLWLMIFNKQILDDLKLSSFKTTLTAGPMRIDNPPDCFKAAVQIDWSGELVWSVDVNRPPFRETTIK